MVGAVVIVLADYSVRPARMLEPSAGVGVFVDSMLRHNPNADVMAFEKDLLTGTILRHLYPGKKTRTCGFEKIERPFNNYFDLDVYKRQGDGWNVYSEIKRKLTEDYGIPPSEVRFMQECKTDKARKAVIDAMNAGTVRVPVSYTHLDVYKRQGQHRGDTDGIHP